MKKIASGLKRNVVPDRIDLRDHSSVGEVHSAISTDYAASVGANLFAHNSLSVRINSHLQTTSRGI
jgi:hypothetical protein